AYEFVEARDGAEGLARARRDDPDVVILDLQMPVMSGQEVLKQLARDPGTRDIPVIVSTSLPLTPELQAQLFGAVSVLSKSNLSKESLLGAVASALDRGSFRQSRSSSLVLPSSGAVMKMQTAQTRILAVDDNEAALYATSRVLKKAGFAVIEATTGEQALEIIRRERPPVVVLDVNLPGISGIEVCRRIKQ